MAGTSFNIDTKMKGAFFHPALGVVLIMSRRTVIDGAVSTGCIFYLKTESDGDEVYLEEVREHLHRYWSVNDLERLN